MSVQESDTESRYSRQGTPGGSGSREVAPETQMRGFPPSVARGRQRVVWWFLRGHHNDGKMNQHYLVLPYCTVNDDQAEQGLQLSKRSRGAGPGDRFPSGVTSANRSRVAKLG